MDDPLAARPRARNQHGETAHTFGDGLAGVLHHPVSRAGGDTAVILMNAGMVQRVGPYRGGLQLARALAAGGFAVLRFDQSGLGDSPVAPGASPSLRHDELRAAIDLVAARIGARRFVIGGICSAADYGFNLAAAEPRVHGVLLLDGLAYRTFGYWWRHLLPRLADPAKVWRWLRRHGQARPSMADFRDFPTRDEAARQLGAMVARDVRLLFVFTGGAHGWFNHAAQLASCLGPAARSPQVTVEHWPGCDHTFYLQRDRTRLQRAVLEWLRNGFAPAAVGGRVDDPP